ncbi:MAG: glycosyltransferase [Planctomycetes bacterium]|nr:glycosyltransferase [Planctomycetota bacterium]
MSNTDRPRVRGKFLYVGPAKFFIRGVTYGPFPKNSEGHPFPERAAIRRDFQLMCGCGINTLRTYIDPPGYLLDLAAEEGLKVMAGAAWYLARNCIYDDPDCRAKALESVRGLARTCRGHPAILLYCVGNEVPPLTVRWHGGKRVERFVRDLCDEVKAIDPDALVTYANHPPTEYLSTDFLDLHAYNVYLERQPEYRAYLYRLQNLCGPKPLFLSEVGVDARRKTEKVQAEWLEWTVRDAFTAGLAGIMVFSWTDEWSERGYRVTDWQFGITASDRSFKPAAEAVRTLYSGGLEQLRGVKWPRVSVVVVTYNGGRTLRETLDSLMSLHYPDHEILVVNDGSTDDTEAIAQSFPRVKLISTENRGLSAGRNTGLEHASGEIIAYTDDDCRVDPDWLLYLVSELLDGDDAAVGGPNLPPEDDPFVAQCVAAAPGGPNHVLLNDREAEHIPGCNMAFRTQTLRDLGGFDPFFVTAGDDVDVCWRLRDHGLKIRFAPSAVVWHRRRPSVGRYLRQQRGYGDAETRLERKHPHRFNALGYMTWRGVIEGRSAPVLPWLGPIIYHGPYASSGFQTLYHRPLALLEQLPSMPETYAAAALLALASWAAAPWLLIAPALLFALIAGRCVAAATQAARRRPMPPEPFRLAAVVGLLHALQPLARGWGRVSGTIRHPAVIAGRLRRLLRRAQEACKAVPDLAGPATAVARYHPVDLIERDTFLGLAMRALRDAGAAPDAPVGWEEWDVRVRAFPFARAELVTAIDDVERDGVVVSRVLLVRASIRTRLPALLVAAAAALATGWAVQGRVLSPLMASLLLAVLAWSAAQRARLRRVVVAACDHAAGALGKESITSIAALLQAWAEGRKGTR